MLDAGAFPDAAAAEAEEGDADASPLPFVDDSAFVAGGAGEAVEEGALLLLALDCALCLSTIAFQSLTNDFAWSATFLSEFERNLPTATPILL